MQRLLYILLLLFAVSQHAVSQTFAAEWMTCPEQTDTSCLWFRRTFVAAERPCRASVRVASDSRFILYVNGRNVSTALYMPVCGDGASRTVAITFDVTRFLRPDSNTVALLASPSLPRMAAPRVAVDFFGVTAGGCRFARSNVDGWLCRPAGARFASGGELYDSRLDSLSSACGDMALVQWVPAAQSAAVTAPPADIGMSAESVFGYSVHGCNVLADDAVRVAGIVGPQRREVRGDTVVCDFAPGLCGFMRVTLRGCRRGERIRIGGFTYVCSGYNDEQAFCRFSPQYFRSVAITGDCSFSPEQVQDVEAVCI